MLLQHNNTKIKCQQNILIKKKKLGQLMVKIQKLAGKINIKIFTKILNFVIN